MSHPRDLAEYERFPALHELLDSYASIDYTFTDTPDQPGPALQAYARLSRDTPDRLDMAVREIDELLHIGLASEEIANDVDLLPRIKPAAGRSVEECLQIARDHLIRMAGADNVVKPMAPQTKWEWRARFPELHQLLGAYFHQDFSHDYASHDEAIADYSSGAPTDDIRQAVEEIHTLLSLIESDTELSHAANVLGLEVYPPKGTSLRQWLTDVSDRLARSVEYR
ncbi:contact-dependent growth inhibition system immunity protein [Streptomyces sp. NPDC048639]|uniref:contact-dependent growth inhibition system immunity protein n=1 Tax=Streptomyces sp. NPDC048639 TaxID=3365581 RepID=UPI003717090E